MNPIEYGMESDAITGIFCFPRDLMSASAVVELAFVTTTSTIKISSHNNFRLSLKVYTTIAPASRF